MRNFLSLSSVWIAGSLLCAAPALAQCVSDPFANPTNTFAFSATAPAAGSGRSDVGASTIAGLMTATPRPFGNGWLSIIATHVSTSGTGFTVTRTDNGTGQYVFSNPACTQGTIFMNLGFFPVQFDFTVGTAAGFGTVINLRSTAYPPIASGIPPTASPASAGTAWPALLGCPAGVAPIDFFNGTYRFSLSGIGPSTTGTIQVGPPLLPTWLNRGSLTVTPDLPAPPQGGASPFPPPNNYPLYSNVGMYSVNSDCRRGTIDLNTASTREFQYDFYTRVSTAGVASYLLINTAAGVVPSTPLNTFALSTGTITR